MPSTIMAWAKLLGEATALVVAVTALVRQLRHEATPHVHLTPPAPRPARPAPRPPSPPGG